MNKTALITGATSGIGKACAELLASNNYNLILCGRREQKLNELARKLEPDTKVLTLSFDVKDRELTTRMIASIPDSWKPIDVLINNAGNAHGLSPIQQGDIDDWEAMIDINVKGLLYVSRSVIPMMVDQKQGHIINIGSIAGKEAYAGGNVYCASKFAVDALNKSMLIDLNGSGIKVTAINPGLVATEFSEVRFKGDKTKAKNVYRGMEPLKGEDIAEVILFVLTRPSHVNISDLIVFPTAQASATIVARNDD